MPVFRPRTPTAPNCRRSVLVTLAVVGLLGGCARSVDVPLPADVSPAAQELCAEVSLQLPPVVAGQTARSTVPRAPTTAAWGDPPITWRCAVGRPDSYTPTSPVIDVLGVTWLPVEHEGGYVFTTIDRSTNVELTVPNAYAPEGEVVATISPIIASLIPPASAPSPDRSDIDATANR